MDLKQTIQVTYKDKAETTISRVSLFTKTYENGKRTYQLIGEESLVPCRGFVPALAKHGFNYTYKSDISDTTRWNEDKEEYFSTVSGYFGSIKMTETAKLKEVVTDMQEFVEEEVMKVVKGQHSILNEAMKDETVKKYMEEFIKLFNNAKPAEKQTLHQIRFQDCTFTVEEKDESDNIIGERTDYSLYVGKVTTFKIGNQTIPKEQMYMKEFDAKLAVDYPSIHFMVENGKFKKIITKIPIVNVEVFSREPQYVSYVTKKIKNMKI